MPAGIALAVILLPAGAPLRAADLDKYLPEDTESVLNLNVRQILDSPLIKKHALPVAQEALKDLDRVQEILKDLNFDPFKDLDRVIVASSPSPSRWTSADKDRGLIIAHGRFDPDKFKAKGDDAATNNPDVVKVHKVNDGKGGQFLIYEFTVNELDTPIFAALASKDTLLASPGKDYVVDALKKTGRPLKPALKNKEFQDLLEKVDDRQSLSLAVVKTEATREAISGLPGDVRAMLDKIVALSGGLTLSDEVKLEIVATTKTVREARELYNSVDAALKLVLVGLVALSGRQQDGNPALDFTMELVRSARLTTKGKAVVLKSRVSSDFIEDTLKKKSK
jgi:hypothetical protein